MAAGREDLVNALKRRGALTSGRVIDAFQDVPRADFVPAASRDSAYEDTPVPIGAGQTISAPHMVAHMTELLEPQPKDVVLEIGTGSGYQAAILSRLVGHVYTLEIVDELVETAKERLQDYENVTVVHADGSTGYPEHAPYDKILYTAAAPRIPDTVFDQLADGGRLVAPVETAGRQELTVYTKQDGEITEESKYAVRFVPLTGEEGVSD